MELRCRKDDSSSFCHYAIPKRNALTLTVVLQISLQFTAGLWLYININGAHYCRNLYSVTTLTLYLPLAVKFIK